MTVLLTFAALPWIIVAVLVLPALYGIRAMWNDFKPTAEDLMPKGYRTGPHW